jgi:hypothetical protein
MLKISFWLKKPNTNQESLEYITIDNPKIVKIENDTWERRYNCEVYLSYMKKHHPPIYGTNPIDTLKLALELAKIRLQGLIAGGYAISEVESRKPWKLEKGKSLSEQINEIKNNKDISTEDKQKILGILKETFGKIPHMKDKFNI